MLYLVLVCLVVCIAIPFGRRNDWVGTAAMIVLVVAAVMLWSWMIMGFVGKIREQWQSDDSDP